MRETLQVGPENLALENCIKALSKIFKDLDVKCINDGYKKTGLSIFQSEPTIETQLSREEQVMNLCERFERFACSDSDED